MTGSIRNLSPHFHVLTSPGLYEYSWKLHQADGAPVVTKDGTVTINKVPAKGGISMGIYTSVP
jgi:hypothetical protein